MRVLFRVRSRPLGPRFASSVRRVQEVSLLDGGRENRARAGLDSQAGLLGKVSAAVEHSLNVPRRYLIKAEVPEERLDMVLHEVSIELRGRGFPSSFDCREEPPLGELGNRQRSLGGGCSEVNRREFLLGFHDDVVRRRSLAVLHGPSLTVFCFRTDSPFAPISATRNRQYIPELSHTCVRSGRTLISGSGGPFAVLRFPYERRPSVVFFPTKAEALEAGVKTGDRVIESRTPVPKITRELGYDRDDERWDRKLGQTDYETHTGDDVPAR